MSVDVRRIDRTVRVFACGVTIGLSACASPGIPPGGPPDKLPPQLVDVTPDTNSLNVRASAVRFQFDEVVNERSAPLARGSGGAGNGAGGGAVGGDGAGGGGSTFNSSSGASSLASLVTVSPGDGRERVSWRRDAIEVEPRTGFRPNTTYRVTILPGLGDLRGNILREQIDVVFSTGAQPSTSAISGIIFDWVGNRSAPGARVEVFAPTDTVLRWSTRADSTGRFVVRDLAPGTYALRGWLDVNANRSIDPRELFDSTTIRVDTTAAAELYAFAHDTIGPRIETLEPVDSSALRIKFDRGVDVTWTPDSSTIVIMRSDSSFVQVGVLVPATIFDSLAAAARAAADSAAPPADSAAPVSIAPVSIPPVSIPPAAGARPPLGAPPPRGAATDSSAPPVKLNRPIPVQTWVVRFGAPLSVGEYRLKVRGVRGLTGAVRDSEREFRLRAPAVPRDSSATATPAEKAKPAVPAPPDVRRPPL